MTEPTGLVLETTRLPAPSLERLRELLVYDPESGQFRWHVARPGILAGSRAGGSDGMYGYIKVRFDGASYRAHRLAWFYITGRWPAGDIDHINGIRDDNRFANLREATASENSRNRKRDKDSTSRLKGAYWDKSVGLWKGAIRVGGKLKYLGSFKRPEDAHAAYVEAAKHHFGDFARFE